MDLGYAGLALLTFLENIFPPLPSEIILPLGGFLVAQGQLSLIGVTLAGTLGSVGGGLALYFLGRQVRQERLAAWAERYGGWLLLTADDINEAFDWFGRHGTKAVFLARLVPGVRSLISIPAGACRMDLLPFLLYTTLGTAIWSAVLAYAGMALGAEYGEFGRVLQWATYVVIAMTVLAVVSWGMKKRRRE